MRLSRRHVCLLPWIAVLPGCSVVPLSPLNVEAIPQPSQPLRMREPAVGQRWRYRQYNVFNSERVATVEEAVTMAQGPVTVSRREMERGGELPSETHDRWGALLRDPLWDYPLNFTTPVPLWVDPASASAHAVTHGHYREDGGSFRYWIQCYFRFGGWERVTVAAGRFDACKVERHLILEHADVGRLRTARRDAMWLAPEVGRWVARETSGEYLRPGGDRTGIDIFQEDRFRWELVSWT